MSETSDKLVNYQRVLESLEYTLTEFQQNQSENLQVHAHYLNHQVEYAKTFFQLMQQQNSLFVNSQNSTETAKLKATIIESLDRSMMQFHAQQGETLRIHERYLQDQVEYTKNFFQLVQQEYAQLVGDEAPAQVSLPIIKERDRLPSSNTPKLENPVIPIAKIPESKPESAIKEESFVLATTKIQETKPESVAPVTTNGAKTAKQEIPVPTATEIVSTPPQPTISLEVTPTPAVDLSNLSQDLLAITSEKTGYPIEMLDMDMDMEADLGIDSIKRVEIMGALQEKYPDMPKPSNVEELAELRTIGQIVEYLQSLVSTPASVATPTNQAPTSVEIPDSASLQPTTNYQPAPDSTAVSESVVVSAEPIVTVAEAPTCTADVDLSHLADDLLAITSEKTGYPVEMLELDMDMEADLGIDSIKRVEIMGALQEKYPDLPKPSNVEELAELRTIGQIVEYLQRLAAGVEKKKYQQPIEQPDSLKHSIQRRPAQLQILPPPDFWEFALPEGYITLITDDGSLTTSKVAELLSQQGRKVVVLNFPPSLVPEKSPLPPGVDRVTLQDTTEEHLQQQLAAIATQYGTVGIFIHIHPVFQTSNNNTVAYFPEEKAIVKQVFFMAKHLKKSLTEAGNHGRSCFCTVARLDGAFGLEYKVNYGAIGAGLFGLTKTLIWEWSKVFCRAIDISPEINSESSAHHIVAELHDPNRYLTEVAYGSQGRVTLISVPDR